VSIAISERKKAVPEGKAERIAKRQKLTPPQMAAEYGVDPNKVIGWIVGGELRAINAAANLGGRPRYLIDRADIEAFESNRAVAQPAAAPRRKRSNLSAGLVRHFRGDSE
jgi:CHAT domain-containing protein